MFIVIDFFVSVFCMVDYYFLIWYVYVVQLFEIMFLVLDEYVVVVCIYVVFNDCYFVVGFFFCWVFGVIDEVVEVMFFYLVEVVDFFFYVDSVVKGGQCGLCY